MSTYYQATLPSSDKYSPEIKEAVALKFPKHEIVILGYMTKYGIPADYYESVYEFICQKIGEYHLTNEHRQVSPSYIMYDICENHLEKFRFEKDMVELLEDKK